MFSNVHNFKGHNQIKTRINGVKGDSNLNSIHHASSSSSNERVKSFRKCTACQLVNSITSANAKT